MKLGIDYGYSGMKDRGNPYIIFPCGCKITYSTSRHDGMGWCGNDEKCCDWHKDVIKKLVEKDKTSS